MNDFARGICGIAGGLMVLASLTAAEAGGKMRGEDGRHSRRAPVVYAEGCYWHRGERYCSRYCYVEINGHRYCHHRRSQAVPQAGDEELPPERRYRGKWTR